MRDHQAPLLFYGLLNPLVIMAFTINHNMMTFHALLSDCPIKIGFRNMVSVFMTHFTVAVTETKHAERINIEHITLMEHYSILCAHAPPHFIHGFHYGFGTGCTH